MCPHVSFRVSSNEDIPSAGQQQIKSPKLNTAFNNNQTVTAVSSKITVVLQKFRPYILFLSFSNMATCLASSSATIRIVKLAQCRSRPAVRPSLSRHTIFCRASSNTGSPNDSSIGQQAAQKLQEVIENARPHAERLGRNASAKCVYAYSLSY